MQKTKSCFSAHSSFGLDGILGFLKENKAYFKYRLSFRLFFPSSCFLFADRGLGALGKVPLPMMISALREGGVQTPSLLLLPNQGLLSDGALVLLPPPDDSVMGASTRKNGFRLDVQVLICCPKIVSPMAALDALGRCDAVFS